jgi:translation initiation factor 5
MALYQADLLEEQVVTHWGTHASKKYVDKEVSKKVRKASEPFVKVRDYHPLVASNLLTNIFQWLAEAEADDDEEEEE